MTLTLNNNLKLLLLLLVLTPVSLLAQVEESQTLSVSPTLFQMSATPSQSWSSSVRVINVNEYDITVYPQVVNFAPSGESGTGALIPVFSEETKGTTLAEWVALDQAEVTIKAGQTATIPFSVQVPDTAAPGGHYAAILVGTRPPQKTEASSQVQTAQFVTSLLFVRISGDVVEAGSIREFTTSKILNNNPDIQFDIRFENTGNVHLQPQGDIVITNMWGTERGIIPINYQTHFGNVLPNSIRKFSFTWTGEGTTYDIGRFKAVATVGYGEAQKNFATSTTYFWVVPVKEILFILLGITLLLWFFSFAIKLYIKRMLTLAGLEPIRKKQYPVKRRQEYSTQAELPAKTMIIRRYQAVTAPVRFSFVEFMQSLKSAEAFNDVVQVLIKSIFTYRIFVVFVLAVIAVFALLVWFFSDMNTKSRPYDVGIVTPDTTLVISSDELLYRSLPDYDLPSGEFKGATPSFTIELVNSSGEPGLAAFARKKLEAYGYTVAKITNELERSDTKTVIIFNPSQQVDILELSKKLNGALLSADTEISNDLVRIYIGTDNRP